MSMNCGMPDNQLQRYCRHQALARQNTSRRSFSLSMRRWCLRRPGSNARAFAEWRLGRTVADWKLLFATTHQVTKLLVVSTLLDRTETFTNPKIICSKSTAIRPSGQTPVGGIAPCGPQFD